MSSVTFPVSVGGDGSTVSDDANVLTGLDAGGHRTRFIPALSQVVAIAAYIVQQVATAVNAAASAVNAPGTSATSSTSRTIGTSGNYSFLLNQTGKLFSKGQSVVVASAASPTNQMIGVITDFSANTLTLAIQSGNGSGTFADWSIALTATGGVPVNRQIATSGLATGGGDFSQNRTVDVAAASISDVRNGTSESKAVTPGSLYASAASVSINYAATITPNGKQGLNFHVTLTGNVTLAAIADAIPGESGRIRLVQDNTGSRAISLSSAYKFAGGLPIFSTSANAVDLIAYYIHDANNIECVLVKDVK